MLVKDLIKELQKIPEDANITIGNHFDGEDGHIAVKFYMEEYDYWACEHEIDYYLENIDKFPEKVRFRLEPNDESYRKYHNEK